MFDQDKTEAATPRRRQQARDKGQSGRSQDLVAAIVLLAAIFLLYHCGERLVLSIFQFSCSLYQNELWLTADPDAISRFLSTNALSFIISFASVAVILVFAGIGSHLLQTGWFFLPEKVIPDFNRISPMRGLARIFSLDGLIRTGTGFVKIVVCSAIAWFILYSQSQTILHLGENTTAEIFVYLCSLLFKTAFTLAGTLLGLAIIDVIWQKWKFERDLRMTPQEIREELKETIGDPILIEQRRRRQQEIGSIKRSHTNTFESGKKNSSQNDQHDSST